MPSKRRSSKPKVALRRGPGVVAAVLEATREELARVGFSGLSMEEVAARAKVNKTTVYRRWPTRADLVKAAIIEVQERVFENVDTGDLRRDLFELSRAVRSELASTRGRGVALALTADDPGVCQVARSTRQQAVEASLAVLGRAIARGELPPQVDQQLLLDAVFGPLEQKAIIERVKIDDAWLKRLIELAITGAIGLSSRKAVEGSG